jgi:hypothetical protein
MEGESTGTGKWRQGGVPHKGWTCVRIEDLEVPSHVCEMCENQLVRYVHTMRHPEYPEVLRVGCICAGHLEEDVTGARRRETNLKSVGRRRALWLARKWRVSRKGNPYLNTNDGFNVVVFRNDRSGTWAGRIEHRPSGYVLKSRQTYGSETAVKLSAFEAIVKLKERRPWEG